MSPQTCTNCGSELAPGQRFCPGCGTPVADAPTEAVAAPPPKQTPRRGRRLLLVGGGCVVLLACICMALFVAGSLPSDTGVTTSEPVETLEAVEAWEAVEVVSERELTPDEFFQRLEGDERFAEVYALASEQGYTQAETGVEAIMSDGSVLAILPLSSPEGESIAAFRVEGDERSNSLLARFEGEALVLYDREGRAEITEQGVRVFDAAGNPIGETHFQGGSRPPALARALQQQGCRGGDWEDYDHCTRRITGMPGSPALALCAAGMATCVLIATGTLGGGVPACVLALVSTFCPVFFNCEVQMSWDDPPTFEVKAQVLPEPCRRECVVGGQEGVREVPNYRFVIVADDDRKPPGPWPPAPFDLCEDKISDYANLPEQSRQVRDCGGNKVPIPYNAILASLPPAAEHECVLIEEPAPAPMGGCRTPGARCVVKDRFDLGPDWPETWVVERNEVNISFPVDGGPVSGDFHFGVTMDEGSDEWPCIKRFDWSGRLSGQFDPESRRLGDSVEDATATLKVEGCEGGIVHKRNAISWRATYDRTTGELKGEVEFEHEVTKLKYWQPFHGIAVED